MANASDYSGGTQPQKPSPTSKQGPSKPAAGAPGRKGRLDGITSLSGTVTFGASAVSINVTMTPTGGGDSASFAAAGAPGNSAASASDVSASRSGDNVTSSSLPAFTAGMAYTAQVRYTSGSVRCNKTATIAATSVSANAVVRNVSFT